MGLFDGFKIMMDMVKTGIDAFKATEQMDKMVEKAFSDFGSVLTDKEKELNRKFEDLKAQKEAEKDQEKATAMISVCEHAEVDFLTALLDNPRITDEFKAQIREALDGYAKSENAPEEVFERSMMKMAKTDAQKEEVRKAMEEAKAEEAAKKQN